MLMLEILAFIFLGIFFGVIAGLIPGIHPNLFALIIGSIVTPFLLNFSPLLIISFLVSLGITNSIVSFIPAISLGAPDPSDALATLPGHRLLMKGLGYFAIKLTAIGGLFSLIASLLILPFTVVSLPKIYPLLKSYMHFLLSLIVAYLILIERRKFLAFLCFTLSGIIGILGSRLTLNPTFYFFPILTGLFAIPLLITSLRNEVKIPHQSTRERKLSNKTINKNVIIGSLAGLLTGILPGIGAAQATVLASVGEKSDEGFLVAIGATTTTNILFSLLAIWIIGKPRSGIAVVIDKLTNVGFYEFLFMVIVSVISGAIATIITLKIARLFLYTLSKLNYKLINTVVLIFLVVAIVSLTGIYGLLLAIIGTCLGLFTLLSQVRRFHLMGVLILPTILFFAGML